MLVKEVAYLRALAYAKHQRNMANRSSFSIGIQSAVCQPRKKLNLNIRLTDKTRFVAWPGFVHSIKRDNKNKKFFV